MGIDPIIEEFLTLTREPIWITHRPNRSEPARITWVNHSFSDYFGIRRDEALGMDVRAIHDPECWDDFVGCITQAIERGERSFAVETVCRLRDGSRRWVNIAYFMKPMDGEARRGFCSLRDIDELKRREASATGALEERERLFAELQAVQTRLVTAINAIPDPFAIYDEDQHLRMWNPAFAENSFGRAGGARVGMDVTEVLRASFRNGCYPEARGREDEVIREILEHHSRPGEPLHMRTVDDRHFSVHLTRAPSGDIIVLRTNITEIVRQQEKLEAYAQDLKRANDEILHQAFHDELTGLGNRRYLAKMLDEMIWAREAEGGEIAALHFDLDRFKQINDTIGHAAGDFVLKDITRRLKRMLKADETMARIGGDEFVVLMRCEAGSDAPERLAARLIAETAKPLTFEGRPCRVGASVGLARTPLIDAHELLTSSDVALYRAKNSGRGQYAVFDAADLKVMRATKLVADDILRGLEEGEFVPHFQPQVDPRTNEIAGFEALARWQHPERGLLVPKDFLAVATDLQVEGQIDEAIFTAALQAFAGFFRGSARIPSLSFNVSAQRLLDDRILSVAEHLARYPGGVAFELLETIFLDEPSEAFLARVEELRGMGVCFEIDDFGSGRASIVSLTRIAPDRLKIDKRLVGPITHSESARQLTRSIVDIGRALDIRVTAEGVETAEHARILTGFGCDRLQGYHYARPMPFAEAVGLLRGEVGLARGA